MSTEQIIFCVIILCIIGAAVAIFLLFRKNKKSAAGPSPQNGSQDSADINQAPVTEFIQVNLILKCVGGILNGNSYPIADNLCIGRNAALCNVIYPESESGIDGIHCKITIANGKAQLTDMGSSTGTFINGVQILQNLPYPMPAGSSFYICSPENTFIITE